MLKSPLLLLHGALGNQQQVLPLKPFLTDSFEVHVLNFEGHDGVETQSDFSKSVFTENVCNYITTTGKGPFHIFGYSMGGFVALNVALQHPELVASIVTLSTKFDWTPESAQREVKMLNPEVIEEKVPKFANRLKAVHGDTNWKQVIHKTAAMMQQLGNGEAMYDEAFQQIHCPVLVTVGDLDKMVSQEESKTAAEAMPNSYYKLLEGFYHPIEKNDQEQIAGVIKNFCLKV